MKVVKVYETAVTRILPIVEKTGVEVGLESNVKEVKMTAVTSTVGTIADPDLETVYAEVGGAVKVVTIVMAVTGKLPIDKKTPIEIGVANSGVTVITE